MAHIKRFHKILAHGLENPAFYKPAQRLEYIESLRPELDKFIPHSSCESLIDGKKYSRTKFFAIKTEHEPIDYSPNVVPLEFVRTDGKGKIEVEELKIPITEHGMAEIDKLIKLDEEIFGSDQNLSEYMPQEE